MLLQIKKIIFSVIILASFQTSFAFDLCSLEGDFVPWPWSEQYYDQVISQNWIIVNGNGMPTSEVSLAKTNLLWGWGREMFTLVEKTTDGEIIRWGMAVGGKEKGESTSLVFNMWGEDSVPDVQQKYEIQMGYWSSSKGQMTIDEEETYKNTPALLKPFLSGSNKVCKSFRQRTDKVIGLVINVETNGPDGVQVKRLFGLTQDPIYTQN
jgi:hypothetical protein